MNDSSPGLKSGLELFMNVQENEDVVKRQDLNLENVHAILSVFCILYSDSTK